MPRVITRAIKRDHLIAKLVQLAAIEHSPEEEETPIVGSFAYGDDAEDGRMERHVREMLRRTPWGWCTVKTTATYAGFSASTYLGCCSYESAEDFRQSDGLAQSYEVCAALLDAMLEAKERGKNAWRALSSLRGG